MSVKDPGNTFKITPKWERTLPSLIYFSSNIYRDPPSTIFFQISKLIFDTLLWENIRWKIYQGWQSSFPLWGYFKGIARVFNWHKFLGGILHLKPTAGCQISTLIFEKKWWRGGVSINIRWKIYQGWQSSCPLWAYFKGIVLVFNWLK
jgi:hypothetical protein